MTVGLGLTVLAATCYGMSNVCYGRLRGTAMPHAVCATVAWNVLFLTLALYLRGTEVDSVRAVPLAAWMLFVVVGLLTSIAGRWGLLSSISRIGPSRASTLKNAAPVFSLVFGLVLFRQVPTVVGVAGIASILAGVWLLGRERTSVVAQSPATVAGGGGPARDVAAGCGSRAGHLTGVLIGLLVATSFALADSVRVYALEEHRDALLATWTGSTASFVVAAIWVAVHSRGSDGAEGGFTRALSSGWVVLAGLASSGGLLANFEAVSRILVGYVTAFVALTPVTTALIGYVVSPGHEELGRKLAVSMTLVIAGAALIALGG